MGRLIKWLKEKLTSLFRKKGDTVPAGIQVFDEHGETVADLSTGLTKIIWAKELTTIVPEFSVKFQSIKVKSYLHSGNIMELVVSMSMQGTMTNILMAIRLPLFQCTRLLLAVLAE